MRRRLQDEVIHIPLPGIVAIEIELARHGR